MEKNPSAIILLHEIYGHNSFIHSVAQYFKKKGFDVFYPNLLNREAFSYQEEENAYAYFNTFVGFDRYNEIVKLIDNLKITYQKVFVIGFSVGATIAWRCSVCPACDGIIGFYGSRIRDYLEIEGVCPVLLVFAKQDSFNVETIINRLDSHKNVQTIEFSARHGFMDQYSKHFDEKSAAKAKQLVHDFLDC